MANPWAPSQIGWQLSTGGLGKTVLGFGLGLLGKVQRGIAAPKDSGQAWGLAALSLAAGAALWRFPEVCGLDQCPYRRTAPPYELEAGIFDAQRHVAEKTER